ncbi:MAG: 16S rRNA processing protein RimM [Candidatus Tokpelaia sp.]|nr:MAG: 16S rRNA processing protein RimM [Candidatus Tokpelaia sp.]
MTMAAGNKQILMAVIGKAQGLSGQMRLKFFTQTAQDLARYERFYGKDSAEYKVKALHIHKGLPIMALEGIENRAQAEQLTGLELFVKRSQLADNLQNDEFYQEDLLGFAVLDEAGEPIGRISGFFNFGGGDILEVALSPPDPVKRPAPAGGVKLKAKKALIPFSKAFVPEIAVSGEYIKVDRQAAGLTFDEDKTAREEEMPPADSAE